MSSVDRRELTGPFDLIGDVHGCGDELVDLLDRLGYAVGDDGVWRHPMRTAVFLGDLVDRGPYVVEAATLAMDMVESGAALWVAGNHDDDLASHLSGVFVTMTHGLRRSLAQIDALSPDDRAAFVDRFVAFVDTLPAYLWLDRGRLVAVHAAFDDSLLGMDDPDTRRVAVHGFPAIGLDERGLPMRPDWAAHYRGNPVVVYGHTPVETARWRGNTINLDTGCVFGGSLTALRWPEREIVAVDARAIYRVRG